jgi:hypothetical protein
MHMTTDAKTAPALLWAGRVVSGLVVLFMAFDAVMKIVQAAPVMEATEKLGFPADSIVGIGVVLLASTVIYAVPRTAVLGAILLTGYLGGACATHVRAGDGAFPISFSVGFGVLAWVGLVLRDPGLLRTILMRR